MRKNLSLVLLLIALISVLTMLLDHKIKPPIRTLDHISQSSDMPLHQAPDFPFVDLNNRNSTLSAFNGKIVILHFWATWCLPCVVELPKLMSISKEFQDHIVLLAVSSDENTDTINRFLRKSSLAVSDQSNIYMIWDESRAITHDLYQTYTYPETIIIDRQGKMIRKIPGDADWTSKEMKSYLRGLANKSEKS